MADSQYGKYINHNPMLMFPKCAASSMVKGITYPKEIFINHEMVKDCGVMIDIGWHFTIPDPDPVEQPHTHEYDTVLCFIGADPRDPGNLGAVLEIRLGNETHVLTRTCSVYIPKGLKHHIASHRKVDRSFLKIEFACK